LFVQVSEGHTGRLASLTTSCRSVLGLQAPLPNRKLGQHLCSTRTLQPRASNRSYRLVKIAFGKVFGGDAGVIPLTLFRLSSSDIETAPVHDGGSARRLRSWRSISGLPKLFLSATHVITLRLSDIFSSFRILFTRGDGLCLLRVDQPQNALA
jgi:hypothetical protein